MKKKLFIKKQLNRKILILSGIIIIGIGATIGGFTYFAKNNNLDSNNHVDTNIGSVSGGAQAYYVDSAWKYGDQYDMTVKDYYKDNHQYNKATPNFNFLNKKNVVAFFQTSGSYAAEYHVNNILDTNPGDNAVEYNNDDVAVNSLNIFATNQNIYFSCHGNGALNRWTNLKYYLPANGELRVINVTGSLDHITTHENDYLSKDSSGNPLPTDKQRAAQWLDFTKAFGDQETATQNNTNHQGITKQFYNIFAKTFYNYGNWAGNISFYNGTQNCYVNLWAFTGPDEKPTLTSSFLI